MLMRSLATMNPMIKVTSTPSLLSMALASTLLTLRLQSPLSKSNFEGRIKEASVDDNPIERIAEAVLKAIWLGVRENKLDQELVRMVARNSETQAILKVGDETLLRLNILNDRSLSGEVLQACELAIANLSKGKKSRIVKSLQDGVREMERATETLHEKLNRLSLPPVILRTRCDLCPA